MADAPDSQDNQLDTDAPADPLALFQADLDKARELIIDGDREAALNLCLSVLDKEDLPIRIASTLSLILRDLNQTRTADHIREVILKGLNKGPHQLPKTTEGLLERAEVFADLEAFEEAEDMCHRALTVDPENFSAVNALCAFLGHRDRLDEAQAHALNFCERGGNTFDSFMYFATIFAHLKSKSAVTVFLDKAQEQCTTRTQQAKLDHIRAANDGTPAPLDQHGMAVGIFDTFAENYDTQLAKIKNNGPSMIYTALVELDLPRTQTRRILDAGCGTG